MQEPYLSEIIAYIRQRKDHLVLYTTLEQTRAELLRGLCISEGFQLKQIDRYPRGRQLLQDDEYVAILRDLLNLSGCLDDMEQTSYPVPYQNRTQLYNLYSKIYRLLHLKAKT